MNTISEKLLVKICTHNMGFICLIFALILTTNLNAQQETLDLSGPWKVTLDTDNPTLDNSAGKNKMEGTIHLPSSLAQQGFGFKTKGSEFGVLTPEYKYLGVAVFEKDIVVPKNWKNKLLVIFLERVLWQSKIFIDGKEISAQDALGTPHVLSLIHI